MAQRDRELECPLFFKLQEFLRRHLHIPDEEADLHARVFMRRYWLSDPEIAEGAPAPSLCGND